MKKSIHPKYYPDAQVTCSCGNTFTVGSTLPEIKIDICSGCHPFFTGQQKFVDTQGRVEKFMAKRKKADLKKVQKKKDKRQKKGQQEQTQEKQKTLKEMLKETK